MEIHNQNVKNNTEALESFKEVNRSNIADDLFYQIKELIIEGRLKPGDMLPPELQLCEHMKVGRSTLREALRALSSMGLVIRTKRGTFVNDKININEILPFPEILKRVHYKEVVELRTILEIEIAALAAKRADSEDLAILTEAFESMKNAAEDDITALTHYDTMFHKQLAIASHNELLQNTLEMVWFAIENVIYDIFQKDADIRNRALIYHEKLLEAIINEDSELARNVIRLHLSDVVSTMKKIGLDSEKE